MGENSLDASVFDLKDVKGGNSGEGQAGVEKGKTQGEDRVNFQERTIAALIIAHH